MFYFVEHHNDLVRFLEGKFSVVKCLLYIFFFKKVSGYEECFPKINIEQMREQLYK